MANLKNLILWPAIGLVAAGCITASYYQRYQADRQFAAEVGRARDEAQRIEREFVQFTKRSLPSGRTLAAFLSGLGIDSPTASRMIASARPVFDMRHLRAGNQLSIGRSVLGEIREVRYNIDPGRVLSIEPSGSDFHSTIETIPSHTDEVGVVGQVDGSLFQAVTDAGEKPELAMRLAEIFGWDLDFLHRPTARRHLPSRSREKDFRQWRDRLPVRPHSCSGIQQRRARLSRDPVPRAYGSSRILHARRKIYEESVSAFAAKIRRSDHVPFQHAPLPSDPEGIPRAPWNRLRRAHRHTRPDHRRRQSNFRRDPRAATAIW